MKNQIAFIDEYGTNSFDFDKPNISTHFIVTAIIVDKSKQSEILKQIEAVRKKYFQTGEIKSKTIANDDNRRLKILNEIAKSDFHIYSVVVDKRELTGQGLKYKESFYKFMNGLVYSELYKSFSELEIIADEHGRNDFMLGFVKYVKNKHIPNLFGGAFMFEKSPENVLIQVADFIAGTFARCFDATKISARKDDFLRTLDGKITYIAFFPPKKDPLEFLPKTKEKGFNPEIASLAIRLAETFINEKQKSKEQSEKDQVACLKILILYVKAVNYQRFITTFELMNHLNVGREEPISEQYFRTRVIAKIRDWGCIIASASNGANKGYKIPTSESDIHRFVSHDKVIIVPMLNRLSKCRMKIKLATKNDIDILDKPEYATLRKIVDAYQTNG